MITLRRTARLTTIAAAATMGMALTGIGTAHTATVPPPTVADHAVAAEVQDPIPSSLRPTVIGQACSGALVPLHTIPGLVGPLLDGGALDIIETLLGNDAVTMLHLRGSPLAIATVPGRAGTLVANNVGNDFYLTAVLCNGGGAPLEPHLFLTQVGNPLGAFEGSVTGSVGDSGSAEDSSIGLGSAELGVGSENGMVDLGSTSGSDQGSAVGVGVGFHGSIADVTSGSTGLDLGAGSTGSEAGSEVSQGSLESGSAGALDTSSLTSSAEFPEGSSNGSSIDVGSVIPLAGDVSDSVTGFTGS